MHVNFKERIINTKFTKTFCIIAGETINDLDKLKFIAKLYKTKFWKQCDVFAKNYSWKHNRLNLPSENLIKKQSRNVFKDKILQINFKNFSNYRVAVLLDLKDEILCENTIHCLLSEMPFIILGRSDRMSELQEMDFQTFDFFINEKYSKIKDVDKRNDLALEEMTNISYIKPDHWKNINNAMEFISEHNQFNLLKKLN